MSDPNVERTNRASLRPTSFVDTWELCVETDTGNLHTFKVDFSTVVYLAEQIMRIVLGRFAGMRPAIGDQRTEDRK